MEALNGTGKCERRLILHTAFVFLFQSRLKYEQLKKYFLAGEASMKATAALQAESHFHLRQKLPKPGQERAQLKNCPTPAK